MGREHWVEVTLGDIAKWQSGGTPTATNPEYYNGEIPWLIIGDMNDGFIENSAKKITQLGFENSSTKWVPIDSVLIAMYGSIGKLGISKIACTTNQAIAFTQTIFGNIPKEYLFNYLKYSRDSLLNLGKGGAQSNISLTVLNAYPFPLPPIGEQKRIVEKLDAMLPKVKSAQERLEKIPRILKKFRQSVLAAACSGRLTEDWREGKDMAEWERQYLGDITDIQGGIQKTPVRKPVKNIYPYLRVANVYRNRLELSEIKYFELFNNELEKFQLKNGDILVVEGNGSKDEIGRVALWHEEIQNCVHQNHIIRCRPKAELCFPEYIMFFLNSFDGINLMMDLSVTTAGLYSLSTGKLKKIEIPLPPLLEQHEIVRRVEQMFHLADSLEAKYKKGMEQINKVEQAILAKAFRGDLAEPDPDDEPAEVLLERILAEKERLEGTTRKGKKKLNLRS